MIIHSRHISENSEMHLWKAAMVSVGFALATTAFSSIFHRHVTRGRPPCGTREKVTDFDVTDSGRHVLEWETADRRNMRKSRHKRLWGTSLSSRQCISWAFWPSKSSLSACLTMSENLPVATVLVLLILMQQTHRHSHFSALPLDDNLSPALSQKHVTSIS